MVPSEGDDSDTRIVFHISNLLHSIVLVDVTAKNPASQRRGWKRFIGHHHLQPRATFASRDEVDSPGLLK